MGRVVMQGKEGKAMMPPLGMLSDQEIASVLTFVRRSFGNSASPVSVDLIKEVRGASVGHERPWTEPELRSISQPDGDPRATRRPSRGRVDLEGIELRGPSAHGGYPPVSTREAQSV